MFIYLSTFIFKVWTIGWIQGFLMHLFMYWAMEVPWCPHWLNLCTGNSWIRRDSCSSSIDLKPSPNTEDRLSKLSDGFLCQIPSLLPAKCAVRTCVLSARWKYFWALIPALEFHVPRLESKRYMDFTIRFWCFIIYGTSVQKFVYSGSEKYDCDGASVYRLIIKLNL